MTIAPKSLFFLSSHRHLSLSSFLPLLFTNRATKTLPTPQSLLKYHLLCEAFPDPSQLHENESSLPGTPWFVLLISCSFILQVVSVCYSVCLPARSQAPWGQGQVFHPHSPHCTWHSPSTQWVLWGHYGLAEARCKQRGLMPRALGWQCWVGSVLRRVSETTDTALLLLHKQHHYCLNLQVLKVTSAPIPTRGHAIYNGAFLRMLMLPPCHPAQFQAPSRQFSEHTCWRTGTSGHQGVLFLTFRRPSLLQ